MGTREKRSAKVKEMREKKVWYGMITIRQFYTIYTYP